MKAVNQKPKVAFRSFLIVNLAHQGKLILRGPLNCVKMCFCFSFVAVQIQDLSFFLIPYHTVIVRKVNEID